eukprot:c18700_g1_i1 orf=1274-2488(+)
MGRHTCCQKQKLRKGLWSPEEDEKLISFITKHGHGCWSSLPKQAGLQRCGKSCRLRWINYLRPDLKRGMFSQSEEKLIFDLHGVLGNRWAQIASHLPGRTDNEIKNHWNSCLKKKLRSQAQYEEPKRLQSEEKLAISNNHKKHSPFFKDNSILNDDLDFYQFSDDIVNFNPQGNPKLLKLNSLHPATNNSLQMDGFQQQQSSGMQLPPTCNNVFITKTNYLASPLGSPTKLPSMDDKLNLAAFPLKSVSTIESMQMVVSPLKCNVSTIYTSHTKNKIHHNSWMNHKENFAAMIGTNVPNHMMDNDSMIEIGGAHHDMESDASQSFLNTLLPMWNEPLATLPNPMHGKGLINCKVHDYELDHVHINQQNEVNFGKLSSTYHPNVDNNLEAFPNNLSYMASILFQN